MPDPLVIRIIRDYKNALLEQESAQMLDMARRWVALERALQARIEAVALEVVDMKRDGFDVPEWRLWQLDRFKALMSQLQIELVKYNGYADELITGRQTELGRIGLEVALEVLKANEVSTDLRQLPTTQIEAMAGLASDGSPLKALLEQTWPTAASGMSSKLIEATAIGLNPRNTARAMVQGMSGGLRQAMCIARTEQIRVYRTASLIGYRSSGVVEGFYRMAAHDLRTCLGCLAAEGRFYPLSKYLEDHPQGRCTMVPKIINVPRVEFQAGEAWLKSLPEDKQVEIMGAARLELWKSGRVPFDRFGKTVPNATWGDSIQPTPLSELRRAA